MNVLVINCGSSSLKFQLIDMENEAVQAKGLCERIGMEGSCITYLYNFLQPSEKRKLSVSPYYLFRSVRLEELIHLRKRF